MDGGGLISKNLVHNWSEKIGNVEDRKPKKKSHISPYFSHQRKHGVKNKLACYFQAPPEVENHSSSVRQLRLRFPDNLRKMISSLIALVSDILRRKVAFMTFIAHNVND